MHTREMLTHSLVTTPKPGFVTIEADSNEPTISNGFEFQQSIFPPSLNDVKLPRNPYIFLATMAVIQAEPTQHDRNYSPYSPEPSDPSPISTLPMKLSKIQGWETPHTLTDNATFYSEDEIRRNYLDISSDADGTFYLEDESRRNHSLPSPLPHSAAPQNEEEIKRWKNLSKKKGSVAVCP